MSLSDLPRAVVDDLRLALGALAVVEDRTRAEQAAWLRLADRVDRQTNRQASDNPWLPDGARLSGAPRPACTYSTEHPKSCPCRGDGLAWEPVGGWSRLVAWIGAWA